MIESRFLNQGGFGIRRRWLDGLQPEALRLWDGVGLLDQSWGFVARAHGAHLEGALQSLSKPSMHEE